MQVQNENSNSQNPMEEWAASHRRGKVIGGVILIIAGVLFFAREIGVLLPDWLFTWKMLIITIGIYVGIKHNFKGFGWMIPILIGTAFIVQDIIPSLTISHFIWPVAFILFGLSMIFRSGKNHTDRFSKWQYHKGNQYYNSGWTEENRGDDYLEINSVFGRVQKNVITKDFKGGEINVVFGGAEINLTQADFNGRINLEINTVFGGSQIIVPANWEIKSELTAVLGGVEDKRMIQKDLSSENSKVLVLRGAVVFGGIEIKSY